MERIEEIEKRVEELEKFVHLKELKEMKLVADKKNRRLGNFGDCKKK